MSFLGARRCQMAEVDLPCGCNLPHQRCTFCIDYKLAAARRRGRAEAFREVAKEALERAEFFERTPEVRNAVELIGWWARDKAKDEEAIGG